MEFVEVAQIEVEALAVGAGPDLAVDSSVFVHDGGNKSGKRGWERVCV